ncbi:MAG: hypothetical protein KBT07_09160 [Clostridiales bacterium]|nr:hypothetical protein [Candidatus Scatonaster coprocaballi]
MKRTIASLLIVSAVVFAGCSSTEKKDTTNAPSTTTTEATTEISSEDEETTTQEESVTEEKSLQGLCEYMESQSAVSGETTVMMAGLIGAEEGIKYNDYRVELYRYDPESQAYKDLLANGYVIIEGMDVKITPVSMIDGYILIVNEKTPDPELEKATFNAYFNA